MKKLSVLFALAATPAFAAGDIPFFSLFNTDFVVLIAFLAFVGILLVAKGPGLLGGQLDARADGIRSELDEAHAPVPLGELAVEENALADLWVWVIE